MLQINGTWITAHHKGELYKARLTKSMEEYFKRNTAGAIAHSTAFTGHQSKQPRKMNGCQLRTCDITSPISINVPAANALTKQSITSFNPHTHH